MRTIVLIPTYNEAANLERIVAGVLDVSGKLDVLVVDDASPDGTGKIADRLAAERGGRVRVLHRDRKSGLGAAYLDAYRHALAGRYDKIVTMDADYSHDPRYLPAMLRQAEHADMVVGSRYVAQGGVRRWGLFRRAVSRLGSVYARWVVGLSVRDPTAGFHVLSRAAVQRVLAVGPRSSGYTFQVEQKWIVHCAGLSIVETPIVFENRSTGRSKMTPGIALEAAWRVWTFRLRGRRERRRGSTMSIAPHEHEPRTPPAAPRRGGRSVAGRW